MSRTATLSPERWARLEALFLEALAQPPGVRASWLAARDDESDVLAEVARMLDADAALDTSVDATGGASTAEPGIEAPPRGLEPYRALYAVREGPQASVYLGVHADPEAGFVRRVAIKVVRQAADADLRARFERERRLLAALRHPNIAPLLDGGTTTDGRPYLVMPFVDGTPIDTYCRDQALDLEARIGLFRSVCAAVHHAHQNLVVHRDLKPSNVLVDCDGVPKLLDFGIAKPLNPELTDAALVTTQPSFRPMTPRYASPEQVGGGAITTASDVYSLGVMLHELLTGRPPYALDDRAPAAVAYAIVHEEPPPTGLPRDLDAIVRKALHKEPARRYPSAAALADDLGRAVHHQPVRARPDTPGYRARRFVRRHRAASALAAVAVVAGLAMTVQTVRVRAALTRAEAARGEAAGARARAEAVSSFLVGLFEHADPGVASGEVVSARALVDRAAARIEHEGLLDDQPTQQAALLDSLSLVYRNLGLHDEAHSVAEAGLAIRRRVDAPVADVATSLGHLAWIRYAQGDFDAAEAPAREALALRRTDGDPVAVAAAAHDLAELVHARAEHAEAETLYRESLALRRTHLGADHPDVGESLLELAHLLHDRGATDDGLAAVSEALAILRGRLGDRHPKVATAWSVTGMLQRQAGRLADALASQRRALAIQGQVLGARHPDTLATRASLGYALHEAGRDIEAVEALEGALEGQRAVLGPRHPMVATTLNDLALAQTALGSHAASVAALQEAAAIYQEQLGNAHPSVTTATYNLAKAHRAAGDLAAALPHLRTVVERLRAFAPDDVLYLGYALQATGRAERDLDRPGRALATLAEARQQLAAVAGPGDWRLAELDSDVAACHLALGDHAAAEPLLVASHAVLVEAFGEDHERSRRTAARLAEALEAPDPR